MRSSSSDGVIAVKVDPRDRPELIRIVRPPWSPSLTPPPPLHTMERENSAVLDGLPHDWPRDLTPTPAHPHPQPAPATDPASSPAHTDQSLPSPTSTAFTDTSANAAVHGDSDVPSPLSPETKPLPAVPAPEDVQDPTDLVAQEHALPPIASKTKSELDDPGVKDLGWRDDTIRAPYLIRGMTNDDVFMLLRRFNKVRLPARCDGVCGSYGHAASSICPSCPCAAPGVP